MGEICAWTFLYVINSGVQVPGGVLEDEQGALLPVLAAAGGERHPEPHGLLRHVRHVQGTSSKVSALVIYNPACRELPKLGLRFFLGGGDMVESVPGHPSIFIISEWCLGAYDWAAERAAQVRAVPAEHAFLSPVWSLGIPLYVLFLNGA
jgi:hypothetical protein